MDWDTRVKLAIYETLVTTGEAPSAVSAIFAGIGLRGPFWSPKPAAPGVTPGGPAT